MGLNQNIKITDFNSNQLRIFSINDLIDNCNHYRVLAYLNTPNVEALKLWRNTLKSFQLDVWTKLEKKEKIEIKKKWEKLKLIGSLFTTVNTPNGKEKRINLKNFHKCWETLYEIETGLRVLADAKGMLMTNKITGTSEDPDEW